MADITLPPEVLEKILTRCSVKDLKACRLVSKSWHDSAMLSCRKSSTAQIDCRKRRRSLEQFLQFVEGCKNVGVSQPFVNITLVEYVIEDLTLLVHLFDKCASDIKGLTLKRCTLPRGDALRRLLFELCVNLDELTIANCRAFGEMGMVWEPCRWEQPQFAQNMNLKRLSMRYLDAWSLGISWMELFSHFPALKVLNLDGRGCYARIARAFQAIKKIHMHDPTMLALEEICIPNLGDSVDDPVPFLLQLLKNRNIPLKKLAVKVRGTYGEYPIREIFLALSSTLKALELKTDVRKALNPEDCFPKEIPNSPSPLLENLTELRFGAHVFTSLAILKFTPNLRKLIIEKCRKHASCATLASGGAHDMACVQLKACTELVLENSFAVEVLENVVQWVPNVERLKMPLNNKTFALVCKSWPKLTLLDITLSKVTESGITGLDEEYVDMINTSQGKCSTRIPTVPRANITNLKNLNTFVMGKTDGIIEAFSYCSLYLGFLKLSSLKNLVMFQSFKINPELRKELPFQIRRQRKRQSGCIVRTGI